MYRRHEAPTKETTKTLQYNSENRTPQHRTSIIKSEVHKGTEAQTGACTKTQKVDRRKQSRAGIL